MVEVEAARAESRRNPSLRPLEPALAITDAGLVLGSAGVHERRIVLRKHQIILEKINSSR